jgi:peptide deformylase
MILPIKVYGDPVLRKQAAPVTAFDEDLARLAADMAETMYHAPGIGLAAPQVGVSRRLIVVDISHADVEDRLYVMANPEVVETASETERCDEGCLSIPEFTESVVRPVWAVIRGQDLQGQFYEVKAEGLLARCFLHEIDHLNGILFVDRMMAFRRKLARQRLKKHFGTISLPETQRV